MTGPPTWPAPGGSPPPVPPSPTNPPKPARPVDVDTGFWLWLAALPLMTTGYLVGTLTAPVDGPADIFYPIVALITALIGVVVVTFLLLMRAGYRWARTVLTGGGMVAVMYAATHLFEPDQRPITAVTVAVTGIIGSVLIAGGAFLLHRRDAHGYFTGLTG